MKAFVEPVIEIEKFEVIDVITTSSFDFGMGEAGGGIFGGN